MVYLWNYGHNNILFILKFHLTHQHFQKLPCLVLLVVP